MLFLSCLQNAPKVLPYQLFNNHPVTNTNRFNIWSMSIRITFLLHLCSLMLPTRIHRVCVKRTLKFVRCCLPKFSFLKARLIVYLSYILSVHLSVIPLFWCAPRQHISVPSRVPIIAISWIFRKRILVSYFYSKKIIQVSPN